MQVIRCAKVNEREIPVLISDEREALLAAKAAGRAIIGLWRGENGGDISAAPYAIESLADADERFLERVARRFLGFPWKICETKRLLIREIAWDDFDEIWENQIGRGFGSTEELEAYVKNQYRFYEFGFWALLDKAHKTLVGIAGFSLPGERKSLWLERGEIRLLTYEGRPECGSGLDICVGGLGTCGGGQEACGGGLDTCGSGLDTRGGGLDTCGEIRENGGELSEKDGEILELGYHIFRPFRRLGYGREACIGVMKYAEEEWGIHRFQVRIRSDNEPSLRLAASLGFAEKGK